MGWKASALDVARRTGVLDVCGARYGRRRLTVLGYHRIADAGRPDLPGFASNVSASPETFEDQLDWIGRKFEVVGLGDVLAWLDGDAELPDRAALITFDDGYRDNLDVAAPLLAEHGFPATLFLTTGPTDGGPALFWDLVAWFFANSGRRQAHLPVLGDRSWPTHAGMRHTVHEFVYAAKWLAPERRSVELERLRTALDCDAPDRIPGLYLDWDGVRGLEGWSIGAHTINHPVLTSVGCDEAGEEIAGSARRIREETGQPVRALAYPNGLEGDYDADIASLAASAGIDLAFTLRPGPARFSEVEADPMAVRRTCVFFGDGPGVFAAKTMGITRVLGYER